MISLITVFTLESKKQSDGSFIHLLLYVDDMLITTKNKGGISCLKTLLSSEFEMKDLGATKKILGMEIWETGRHASFVYLSKSTLKKCCSLFR